MTSLPYKWAMRDLRGSLSGFGTFLICLALGVASIVAVSSLSAAITESMSREGQVLLGGDLEVSLVNRPATEPELTGLKKYGQLSEIATMRGMARVPETEKTALIEIKVIDQLYPFFGELAFQQGFQKHTLFQGDRIVAVEKELVDKLGIEVGDRFTLGDGQFTIGSIIDKEPDRVSSGFILRPRVMMDRETLLKTGLYKPGALMRWRYRIKIDDASQVLSPQQVAAELKRDFPDAGWRVTTRDKAAPGLQRFVDRLTLFFTMIALTSLIVGGVAIAMGVRTYLSKKQNIIATLKCLGASQAQILQTYFIEIGLISLLGVSIGLIIGSALPFLVAEIVQDFVPFPFKADIYPGSLFVSTLFGVLTAFIFCLWPLGQAVKTRAAELFRSRILPLRGTPSLSFKLAIIFLLGALVSLFLLLSSEKILVLYYFIALFLGYIFLYVASIGIRKFARWASPNRSFTTRMALRGIYRSGSLTGVMLVSLGLGLMLLVTLSLIEFNLSRQVSSAIPQKAPSYFFIGIEKEQTDGFKKIIKKTRKDADINMQPILNGRVVSVKNIRADEAPASPDVKWVLRGDRGLTFSPTLPEGSKLTKGEWWDVDHKGKNLVSITDEVAKGLELEIGDEIEVNVLGRNIKAHIANMRQVEWTSLGINFVLVFSPNSFAGAPYTYLATASFEEKDNAKLVSKISQKYTNIFAVSVRDSISSIISLMEKMSWGVRGASAFAILIAVLVLAGSLAAQNRSRLYELGILKVMGASRQSLINSYVIEFSFLGLLTGTFAAFAGTICSFVIVEEVLKIEWAFSLTTILSVLIISLILTLFLGMGAVWRQLGRKPAQILTQ